MADIKAAIQQSKLPEEMKAYLLAVLPVLTPEQEVVFLGKLSAFGEQVDGIYQKEAKELMNQEKTLTKEIANESEKIEKDEAEEVMTQKISNLT